MASQLFANDREAKKPQVNSISQYQDKLEKKNQY
jgi:hypothetical protein